MQAIHVDKIIRLVGNGCTDPILANLSWEGGSFYAIIKTKNNPQQILAIVNELICCNLANEIGLLMPKSGIALIDHNTIDDDELITKEDFGYCFYSKHIDKAHILNQNIMQLISNKNIFEDIIIFDHFTYNKDRNKGNLLMSAKKTEKLLYVIDHSNVFKNETIWDCHSLRQGMRFNDYKDLEIMEYNNELYEMFFRTKNINLESLMSSAYKFKKTFNRTTISKAVYSLPDDWEVSAENLHALDEYLSYRCEHLEDICDTIARYKEWRK